MAGNIDAVIDSNACPIRALAKTDRFSRPILSTELLNLRESTMLR